MTAIKAAPKMPFLNIRGRPKLRPRKHAHCLKHSNILKKHLILLFHVMLFRQTVQILLKILFILIF